MLPETDLELLQTNACQLTRHKFAIHSLEKQRKLSNTDIARYSHLIFELTIELAGTPDANGIIPTPLELLTIIDSCFTPEVLKSNNLGFEYLMLIDGAKQQANNYLTQVIQPLINQQEGVVTLALTNHTAATLELTVTNPNRERLKQIVLNKTLATIYNYHYPLFQNDITTNNSTRDLVLNPPALHSAVMQKIFKQYKKELDLRAQIILHDIAKKTLKNFEQRYFSNIIAINAFVKLAAVILMRQARDSKYVITEPAFIYFLAAVVYADLFSNLVTKTFWKDKAYYLSVTLISVVAAAIGAPWVADEKNIGYRAIKAVTIFLTVTGVHAAKILIPVHGRVFHKTRWYLDYFKYEVGGPNNPARIFIANALPIIVAGITSIFKLSGYDVADNTYGLFTVWIIAAFATQILQSLYFHLKLPRYAHATELAQALPKWDLFQLYSYTKNYTLRSRQSENIWTTSAVIYLSQLAFNIIRIYPSKKWLPILLAPCVVLLGSRLGCFFQREVFTRMELPKSISSTYLNYLATHATHYGIERSNADRINKLVARGAKYPQNLFERTQQCEVTVQPGSQKTSFGERNLFASITTIALYYVVMHYLWTRAIAMHIEDNKDIGSGTWPFFAMHMVMGIIVHLILRTVQFTINRFDKLETVAFETSGIITRLSRAAKSLVTDGFSGAVKSLTTNVFIIDKSKERQQFEHNAKQLKHEANTPLEPSIITPSSIERTTPPPVIIPQIVHTTRLYSPYQTTIQPPATSASMMQHVMIEENFDGQRFTMV